MLGQVEGHSPGSQKPRCLRYPVPPLHPWRSTRRAPQWIYSWNPTVASLRQWSPTRRRPSNVLGISTANRWFQPFENPKAMPKPNMKTNEQKLWWFPPKTNMTSWKITHVLSGDASSFMVFLFHCHVSFSGCSTKWAPSPVRSRFMTPHIYRGEKNLSYPFRRPIL